MGTIQVVSRQATKRVKVDKVLCSVPGACEGMRIITNGADVNDVECKAGACNGCVVMQAPEYKENLVICIRLFLCSYPTSFYTTFDALLFYLAFVLTTLLYPDGNTVCEFFNLLTVCI